MYHFNKNQKIIVVILLTIIGVTIYYFVYAKEENVEEIEEMLKIENHREQQIIQNQETEENIIIHIAGCIKNEGILELKINSRIIDAVEKAGGLTPEANIEDINLASILEDGMKIYIPNKKEKQENIINNNENIISEKENNQDNNIIKVNINTATQAQLETLPGIGPSTALKILQYRKEHGKFSKKEDIKEISGIGEAKYNKIKEYIVIK